MHSLSNHSQTNPFPRGDADSFHTRSRPLRGPTTRVLRRRIRNDTAISSGKVITSKGSSFLPEQISHCSHNRCSSWSKPLTFQIQWMIPIIQCSYHIGSIKTQLTGVIWNLIQLHYCPNPVGIVTNHFTEKQRKAKLWLCSPRHGNISQCCESFNQSLQPSLVCLVGEYAHQSITAGSALIAKFPCLWNLLEHVW